MQTREPAPVSILTAMADNERIAKNETDPERKAIALAWLFHLVGDIHDHSDWLFSFENICETLQLNPGYIRRGLLVWKQAKRQSHSVTNKG